LSEPSLVVIFCNSQSRWLGRLFPAGLQHVFVMHHDPRRRVAVVLNPRLGAFDVQVEDYEFIPAVSEESTAVVFQRRAALLSAFCPGLTCVSATKRLLGVWWPFVLTPAQLKRKLLLEGGEAG
jgi:hypothetical protein